MKCFVLLYRRERFWDIAGRLIGWQTRGPYVHASMYIDGVIYQSRMKDGVTRGVPELRDMKADAFRIDDRRFDGEKCRKFLEKQVGKGYDKGSVLRFVSRRQASRKSAGVWFCSEVDYAAVDKAGVPLLHLTEPWEVSPNLLRRSPLLRYVGSLSDAAKEYYGDGW